MVMGRDTQNTFNGFMGLGEQERKPNEATLFWTQVCFGPLSAESLKMGESVKEGSPDSYEAKEGRRLQQHIDFYSQPSDRVSVWE